MKKLQIQQTYDPELGFYFLHKSLGETYEIIYLDDKIVRGKNVKIPYNIIELNRIAFKDAPYIIIKDNKVTLLISKDL